MTTLRCVACGSEGAGDRLGTPPDSYRVCGRCGTGVRDRVIDVEAYYHEYFPAGVREDSPLLGTRYRALLGRMATRAPGRRLLEVGVGNGQLLAVARELGWETAGTELSRTQAEHARARGLEVVHGDLTEEPLFRGRTFDAAVMIEVVEHLPRPLEMLRAVGELLAPGGVLYLTTPNFGSLSRKILGETWSVLDPEHLVLFTPRGMRDILDRADLRPRSVRSRNLNPGEILAGLPGRRSAPAASAAESGTTDGSQRRGMTSRDRVRATTALRDRVEESRLLRLLKGAANAALSATGTGDALVVWARKPA